MLKKMSLILICVILTFLLSSQAILAYDTNFDPEDVEDWSTVDQSTIPPNQINSIPPEYVDVTKLDSTQKQELKGPQISSAIQRGQNLGYLNQYNNAELTIGLKEAGFNIQSLKGDLSGSKIEGNNLILADGSKYDLKSDKPITITTSGGKTTYFTDTFVTIVNGDGVDYSAKGMSVKHADTLYFGESTFTNVNNFVTPNWKTYQMDRSDLVIVETSRIEATRNTEIIIEDNKLIYLNATSEKENNTFKFPNLISQSSKIVIIETKNKGDKFELKYRDKKKHKDFEGEEEQPTDPASKDKLEDSTEIIADENVTVSLPGDEMNNFNMSLI